ncbi:hypothetical protein AGMMS49928_20220 [Spirochaetia bacterium]|nr:hypothetical protein AGMMS49928_20220 [Spirochaetia bacterium]
MTKDISRSLTANTDRLIAANVATGAAIAASARADAQMLGGRLDAGFGALNNTLEAGFSGVERQIGAMSAEINFNLVQLNYTLERMSQNIVERLDQISFSLDNPRYIRA